MRHIVWIGVALALAGVARAQEPAPQLDDLERRLTEQQAEMDRMREELRRMREGAVEPAGTGEPGGSEDEGATPGGDAPGAGIAAEEPTAEGPTVLADSPIKLGLFFIESGDGRHRLELNGRLQVDGRFVLDRDHDDFDNGFLVRRARVDFALKLYEKITGKLGLEFGRTTDADLRDAYLNLELTPWLQVRGGQMLVPFSTERLYSSNYMRFPERPIIIGNIIENREVGLMLHGHLGKKAFSYYLAVFNGNGQNVAQDNDDDKDFVARVEAAPLEKVLLLAASYRYTPTNRQDSHGPADFLTVGNQVTRFIDYSGANRHLGHRERGTLDARVRVGPLEVKGEVVFDYFRKMVSPAGEDANLMNWSWFVDTSVMLTGEEMQDTIDPHSPFYGEDGFGTGAFELSLRYEELHADPGTLRDGFATGTRRARSVTPAFGWWPVRRVRVLLSYTYTDFEDIVVVSNEREDDDHVFVGRMAFYW